MGCPATSHTPKEINNCNICMEVMNIRGGRVVPVCGHEVCAMCYVHIVTMRQGDGMPERRCPICRADWSGILNNVNNEDEDMEDVEDEDMENVVQVDEELLINTTLHVGFMFMLNMHDVQFVIDHLHPSRHCYLNLLRSFCVYQGLITDDAFFLQVIICNPSGEIHWARFGSINTNEEYTPNITQPDTTLIGRYLIEASYTPPRNDHQRDMYEVDFPRMDGSDFVHIGLHPDSASDSSEDSTSSDSSEDSSF